MGKYIDKIKRGIIRETLCVNITAVAVCACIGAFLCLIFSVGGIDYGVYREMEQPRFYFPCIVMAALLIIFCALIGAAAGLTVSTPYYRRSRAKTASVALAVCTLFLCFAWISLVYTASSFFVAFIVCLINLVFSAMIFRLYIEINALAAWCMIIFAFFDFYLACYSISLFILN